MELHVHEHGQYRGPGNTTIPFRVSSPAPGFEVIIDVAVGPACCRAGFTPPAAPLHTDA